MASGAGRSLVVSSDQQGLLRHLAHELRQPLSGIESIAYYFDMVLASESPELQTQCDRLRRMVQFAHWLIEDASLALRLDGAELHAVLLSDPLMRIGTEMALHEERNLELFLDGSTRSALLPGPLARAFCQHVLSFFRGVAQALDPIRVTLRDEGPSVVLEIEAEVRGEIEDLLRALDAPAPGSGVRRFVTHCAGRMQARADGDTLSLTIGFPATQ